ncbi:lactose-binding lectin l-2-like [Patiria miniata]|uniref:C-type lectin domain-containing protein n=1 Tax=Patiria miniata TaxID=46514 RepID=A0A913Z8R0_PATMI|nr:lactose-binding lectin l-2-like [Patiria miniata]
MRRFSHFSTRPQWGKTGEIMVRKRFIFGLISLHLMMGCTAGDEMCEASIRGAGPSSWIKWGGKYYKAIIEPLTWSEAKKECIKMGGALVLPQSDEETDFLKTLVLQPGQQRTDLFWINCNDLEEEDTWKCQDGTDEVEYRNWDTHLGSQPDGRGYENCAEVWSGGKWNDVDCDNLVPAICIRPAPQLHF